MLACVACFGWTTGKYKVFVPLILTEFLSKLLNLRAKKHSFLSKDQFTIFMNKIICSFSTLYVANRGIDVIMIGIWHNTEKPKISLPFKLLTELCNSPLKNVPFLENADSQFLMNTVIHSILTLFTSCKHTHQYSTHAKRAQGLYIQNGGCECELRNKNAFSWAKIELY